jgi:hypothetical protein
MKLLLNSHSLFINSFAGKRRFGWKKIQSAPLGDVQKCIFPNLTKPRVLTFSQNGVMLPRNRPLLDLVNSEPVFVVFLQDFVISDDKESQTVQFSAFSRVLDFRHALARTHPNLTIENVALSVNSFPSLNSMFMGETFGTIGVVCDGVPTFVMPLDYPVKLIMEWNKLCWIKANGKELEGNVLLSNFDETVLLTASRSARFVQINISPGVVFEANEGIKVCDAKDSILQVYALGRKVEFSICEGENELHGQWALENNVRYKIKTSQYCNLSVIGFGRCCSTRIDVFWSVRYLVELLEQDLKVQKLILVRNGLPLDRAQLFCFYGLSEDECMLGTVDPKGQCTPWDLPRKDIVIRPQTGVLLHFFAPRWKDDCG